MAPKRKRARILPKDAPPEVTQPSSRDASGEDTADPVLEEVKERKSMDPPVKKSRATRSGSSAKAVELNGSNDRVRPSSSSARMPANVFQEDGGEHGEAGKMRMPAPPPAGQVDPVGYRTNPPPAGRPVRIYADGVFDLFHLGHQRQLQQAKTAFPGHDVWLIVGVTGDTETHKRKGLTVMSAKERAESLRHCRWVDEVIEDCPWVITVAFLEKHSIDYVAHDDIPYGASEGDDIYKPIKEKGMFLVTQRTEGVSTTGIITKIVRDYEQYISRQFKRGASRKELNVSWLKKNELDMKRHINELRDNIRTNWTTTGQELSRDIKQFWGGSRPNSPAPSIHNGTTGTSRGAKSPIFEHTPSLRGERAKQKTLDFAAGYAMGLVGGVKSWMEGSKRRNLSDSRAQSPRGADDDSEESSGVDEGSSRGRRMDVDDEIDDDVERESKRPKLIVEDMEGEV